MSKRRSIHGPLALAAIISLAASSSGLADTVVIGDWENATDGWIDWGTMAAIDPGVGTKYSYSNIGVTHGSSSIKVTQSSYNQGLSIKLQNNNLKAAFLANGQFSIDVTVPGSQVAGYAQIYDTALNAEFYGFHSMNTAPKVMFGFNNDTTGTRTATVTWDYLTLVDGDTTNGEITDASRWIEFIMATNADADHGTFYFDNARLERGIARGDLNQNGVLDGGDMDLLFLAQQGNIGDDAVEAKYDMNNNLVVLTTPGVAGSDADYWVKTIARTRYGDSNVDEKVDFADLVKLAQNYNVLTGATWSMGNFNGDGKVDFADLVVLAQNYNFGVGADVESLGADFAADWALAQSLVPEPATLGLLALAAPVMRRRR